MCKHRCSKRDCAGHERWATAVVLSAASISEAKGVLQRNKTNKVYDLEILEDEIPAAHWANFALMGAQYVSSENSAGERHEPRETTIHLHCNALFCVNTSYQISVRRPSLQLDQGPNCRKSKRGSELCINSCSHFKLFLVAEMVESKIK